MPGISNFTQHEIAEHWAADVRRLDHELTAANKALLDAGISEIGTLAERITRLARGRDALIADMVRDRECLDCKHKWTSPLRRSTTTTNISGEATEWCPKCGTRNVISEPPRLTP